MENYLSLETALKELTSNTPIPNEFNQIANLATYGEITPTVRYNGLLSIDDNEPITAICFITSNELIDLIDDNQSEITLQTAIIYDGTKTGLEHGQAVKLHTAKTYRQSNILIPEHDIARQLFNDLTDPATADKELIAELYARIDKLENQLATLKANTQSHTPINDEHLAVIMDKANPYHAPDLAHAINLWLDLYNTGKQSQDSHHNRVNNWIRNNTGYSESNTQTIKRIREITTPLQQWNNNRSKENQK